MKLAQEFALDRGVERLAGWEAIQPKCEFEEVERSESDGAQPPLSERMYPSDD